MTAGCRLYFLAVLNLKRKIAAQEAYLAIRDYLPEDPSGVWSLNRYLEQFYARSSGPVTALDLGCGEGHSIELFESLSPETAWHGVDIEGSPEVKRRLRDSDRIATFDGVHLPFSDQVFDLIYCHQVLEHVRHPDGLIGEAFRTMKPQGVFMGSVSYLEPYHSYSIFNFTPYGIARVFGDAGFELLEIRPGVDATMLMSRQLLNRSKLLRPVWQHNFLHRLLGILTRLARLGHRQGNFLKAQFAGHLVFLARRPA